MVDILLELNAHLNSLREHGYQIKTQRDGRRDVVIPYDVLLKQMQAKDSTIAVYNLFDARAAGFIQIPDTCDTTAQISRVYTPEKQPNQVVLRTNQLWLEVGDEQIRRYLLNYLAQPQWKGKSWNEICSTTAVPDPSSSLQVFFAEEERIIEGVHQTMNTITETDLMLDNKILDLYGIYDNADRKRVLGNAPESSEDEATDGQE